MHAVGSVGPRWQNKALACHPRPCTRTRGPGAIAAGTPVVARGRHSIAYEPISSAVSGTGARRRVGVESAAVRCDLAVNSLFHSQRLHGAGAAFLLRSPLFPSTCRRVARAAISFDCEDECHTAVRQLVFSSLNAASRLGGGGAVGRRLSLRRFSRVRHTSASSINIVPILRCDHLKLENVATIFARQSFFYSRGSRLRVSGESTLIYDLCSVRRVVCNDAAVVWFRL